MLGLEGHFLEKISMNFMIYCHTAEIGWKLYGMDYHDISQAIAAFRDMDSNRRGGETLVLISTEGDHTQLWFQHGPERSLPDKPIDDVLNRVYPTRSVTDGAVVG